MCMELSGNVSFTSKDYIQISGDDDDSFEQSLHHGERYNKLRQTLHLHIDNIKNECQIWLCFGDMPFAIVFSSFAIDEYDVSTLSQCTGFFCFFIVLLHFK